MTYATDFATLRTAQAEEATRITRMWCDRTGPIASEVAVGIRAACIALADRYHSQYPQYANHWDGAEWRLARAKRDMNTKGGPTIRKGDLLIAREYTPAEEERYVADRAALGLAPHPHLMAHSNLTQTDTALPAGALEWVRTA